MESERFPDNIKTDKKFTESSSEIKNKNRCSLYRNVTDDVWFQKHFTDLDYLDRFSIYERFCGICKHCYKFALRKE